MDERRLVRITKDTSFISTPPELSQEPARKAKYTFLIISQYHVGSGHIIGVIQLLFNTSLVSRQTVPEIVLNRRDIGSKTSKSLVLANYSWCGPRMAGTAAQQSGLGRSPGETHISYSLSWCHVVSEEYDP